MQDREKLISICHKVYEKGFVAASDGNVSAITSDNTILITRSGICKGDVAENVSSLENSVSELNQDATVNVVKTPQEIAELDGLIIPGGESTTTTGHLAGRLAWYEMTRRSVSLGAMARLHPDRSTQTSSPG